MSTPCNERLSFVSDNPLSVSHIIADNTNSGVCAFFGVDGSVTVLSGETAAEVGPPQQLVSGSCVRFTAVRPRSEFQVGITFIGAGPDPPTCFQLFPTDDNSYAIGKLLTSLLSASWNYRLYDGLRTMTLFALDQEYNPY